jgi:hypothetical protein
MSAPSVCALCGEEFDKAWSEEEAIKEMEQNFGTTDTKGMAEICDDCFKKVMRAN